MPEAWLAEPQQGQWPSWTSNSASHEKRPLHSVPMDFHPPGSEAVSSPSLPVFMPAVCAMWLMMALGHSAASEHGAH